MSVRLYGVALKRHSQHYIVKIHARHPNNIKKILTRWFRDDQFYIVKIIGYADDDEGVISYESTYEKPWKALNDS